MSARPTPAWSGARAFAVSRRPGRPAQSAIAAMRVTRRILTRAQRNRARRRTAPVAPSVPETASRMWLRDVRAVTGARAGPRAAPPPRRGGPRRCLRAGASSSSAAACSACSLACCGVLARPRPRDARPAWRCASAARPVSCARATFESACSRWAAASPERRSMLDLALGVAPAAIECQGDRENDQRSR